MWLLAKTILIPDDAGQIAALGDVPPMDLATPDYGMAFLKMFLTLIALGALLVGTLWYLRRLIRDRWQKGTTRQSIQVIDRRMISPKTALYLVEVEGERVLLAESHLEIRRLHTLTDEALPREFPSHPPRSEPGSPSQ